jgi:NIMA-interacting peptidyl-prolyl cis-trans isomerase 4
MAKAKGKSKDANNAEGGGGRKKGGLKPATSINVRHILCEKHGKKEDALQKIREGRKFDDVAREMSEDKARQGEFLIWLLVLNYIRNIFVSLANSTTWHVLIYSWHSLLLVILYFSFFSFSDCLHGCRLTSPQVAH